MPIEEPPQACGNMFTHFVQLALTFASNAVCNATTCSTPQCSTLY